MKPETNLLEIARSFGPHLPKRAPEPRCAVCSAPCPLYRRGNGPWACPQHRAELYPHPLLVLCEWCANPVEGLGHYHGDERLCDSCAGES